MSSQIDHILHLTERGWHPYMGVVAPEVYIGLGCPAPLFAKWLYDGKDAHEASCVGCERLCTTSSFEGFNPSPQRIQALYRGQYGYFTLWPCEMVKRIPLLRVDQVAYCLNISRRTVYDFIERGKLTATKEKPCRVRAEDVAALMTNFDE